jgi:hypothetical protein
MKPIFKRLGSVMAIIALLIAYWMIAPATSQQSGRHGRAYGVVVEEIHAKVRCLEGCDPPSAPISDEASSARR